MKSKTANGGRDELLSRGKSMPSNFRFARGSPVKGTAVEFYPTSPSGYELMGELGVGATATVFCAMCVSLQKIVAVKLVDLEKVEDAGGLDVILKEVSIMRELRHPAVLPLLASFTHEKHLWLVMPYFSSGSLQSIMEWTNPQGFDDWNTVATSMLRVLKAMEYMHARGFVHRDVKAANIMVGGNGHVVLGDFGACVAMEPKAKGKPELKRNSIELAHAFLAQPKFKGTPQYHPSGAPALPLLTEVMSSPTSPSAPRRPTYAFNNAEEYGRYLGRTTFVGTPCWMAPEVMAPQEEGYSCPADIWSFGITLVEIVTGAAPNSQRTMDQILINVLQSEDPTGIVDNIAHTPEAFKEVVYSCLCKEAGARPTATQLMQCRFFRDYSFDEAYLVKHMLQGVPPATERFKGGSRPKSRGGGSGGDVRRPPAGPAGAAKRQNLSGSGKSMQQRRTTGQRSSSFLAGQGAQMDPAAVDHLLASVSLFKRLARTAMPTEDGKHALTVEHLQKCKGLGYALVKRLNNFSGQMGLSRGSGFVVAKLPGSQGGIATWSAPSFFTGDFTAKGYSCNSDEVGMLYVVADVGKYMRGVHDIAADAGHRNRHIPCCQSTVNSSLCELSISKGVIEANCRLNEALYGAERTPEEILTGKQRPPVEFNMLYSELNAVLDGEPPEEVMEVSQSARSVSMSLSKRIKRSISKVGSSPVKAASSDRKSGSLHMGRRSASDLLARAASDPRTQQSENSTVSLPEAAVARGTFSESNLEAPRPSDVSGATSAGAPVGPQHAGAAAGSTFEAPREHNPGAGASLPQGYPTEVSVAARDSLPPPSATAACLEGDSEASLSLSDLRLGLSSAVKASSPMHVPGSLQQLDSAPSLTLGSLPSVQENGQPSLPAVPDASILEMATVDTQSTVSSLGTTPSHEPGVRQSASDSSSPETLPNSVLWSFEMDGSFRAAAKLRTIGSWSSDTSGYVAYQRQISGSGSTDDVHVVG